jgi:hypothetical protein
LAERAIGIFSKVCDELLAQPMTLPPAKREAVPQKSSSWFHNWLNSSICRNSYWWLLPGIISIASFLPMVMRPSRRRSRYLKASATFFSVVCVLGFVLIALLCNDSCPSSVVMTEKGCLHRLRMDGKSKREVGIITPFSIAMLRMSGSLSQSSQSKIFYILSFLIIFYSFMMAKEIGK